MASDDPGFRVTSWDNTAHEDIRDFETAKAAAIRRAGVEGRITKLVDLRDMLGAEVHADGHISKWHTGVEPEGAANPWA